MGEQLCWLQKHEVLPLVRRLYHAFLSYAVPLPYTLFLQLTGSERHKIDHAKSMVSILLHRVNYRLCRRSTFRLFHVRALLRTNDGD